jgi:hypothetical protein
VSDVDRTSRFEIACGSEKRPASRTERQPREAAMVDGAVREFLAKMQQPPRRRAMPRIAEPLRSAEMHEVAGSQGRIAA